MLPLSLSSGSLDWKTVGTAALAALVVSRLARALWSAYFSSLARIPGPRLAAITSLWLEWYSLTFRRTMEVHKAQLQYGPIVRIGPRMVVVSDLDDVRTVYRSKKFRKSPWYEAIRFGGEHNIVSQPDPELHAIMRRWSSPAFRSENLMVVSAALQELMVQLVERIEADSVGGVAVDAVRLFRMLAVDVVGIAVFGTQFNQMKTGDGHPLGSYLDNFLIDKGLANYLPTPIYWLIKSIPSKHLQRILSAEMDIYNLGSALYDSSVPGGSSVDIIAICKGYKDPDTGLSPPKRLVIGEAAMFLSAGTDTTSLVLTHIAWHLGRDPAIAQELRRELAEVPEHQRGNNDVLKELPYLNAFIKEILRVHGPTPGLLERVVPPEGATFQGHFLPGGTVVCGMSWTAHHDPKFFPDPRAVKPERWVQWRAGEEGSGGRWEQREVSPEVAQAWFPFSFGPRSCVGRPLAEMVILLVTATLVRTFRITLHESATDESMSPMDIAVVRHRANRCLLHFETELL